jgi:DNA-binding transcriptional LysR family regulator
MAMLHEDLLYPLNILTAETLKLPEHVFLAAEKLLAEARALERHISKIESRRNPERKGVMVLGGISEYIPKEEQEHRIAEFKKAHPDITELIVMKYPLNDIPTEKHET